MSSLICARIEAWKARPLAVTAVLTALAWMRPLNKKRYVDISENGLYWYFIVAWWLPVYLTVYFAPRWL